MSLNFERYSVIEKRTGRKICECGNEQDAIMMVEFDPHNRSYSRDRFILDQIIDVSSKTDKQLPGQVGLPAAQELYISEGQGQPVII